jgi:hypothetical protein
MLFCVYSAMSKCPKQLPNYLKRAEVNVVLIVFCGVLFEICAIDFSRLLNS